jgi:hypothetical protein
MSDATEIERRGAVARYARVDVIGGALMVFIAGLVWYGAIELEVGVLPNFGSGALPKALAILLLVSGGGVLLHGLRQPDRDAERFGLVLRPPAVILAAIFFFGLFIRGGDFGIVSTPQLGLVIVGPITVLIAGCATPNVHFKELVVTAFGLTAAMLLVFVDLLGVGVPVLPRFVQAAIPVSLGADAATRIVYGAYGILAGMLYLIPSRTEG